ncbi:hypothetical protein BT69DRAFT_1321546 [Atractiella rhizophila]|nr:hypothetical protein BT69DRAFT_1321546 [Atractiella rhizophila]
MPSANVVSHGSILERLTVSPIQARKVWWITEDATGPAGCELQAPSGWIQELSRRKTCKGKLRATPTERESRESGRLETEVVVLITFSKIHHKERQALQQALKVSQEWREYEEPDEEWDITKGISIEERMKHTKLPKDTVFYWRCYMMKTKSKVGISPIQIVRKPQLLSFLKALPPFRWNVEREDCVFWLFKMYEGLANCLMGVDTSALDCGRWNDMKPFFLCFG